MCVDLVITIAFQIFFILYFWIAFNNQLDQLPDPKEVTNYNLMKYIIDIGNTMITAPMLVTLIYLNFLGTKEMLFLKSSLIFVITAMIILIYRNWKRLPFLHKQK